MKKLPKLKLPKLKGLKPTFTIALPSQRGATLPVDRSAVVVIVLLSVGAVGLIMLGKPRSPQVESFSWAGQTIGIEDTGFTLEFDAPIDWDSVAENLEIEPPLAGKVSWAGQRLAYTLTDLPEYGEEYTLSLPVAETAPVSSRQPSQTLQPFEATFQVRDRAFAYIGVEGEEQGRLILYNLTSGERLTLTPPDLVVSNFQPTADGQAIFFLAFGVGEEEGIAAQQLYRVTTGRTLRGQDPELPGRLELLLDGDRYENRQFTLAAAAETIIVERINRQTPSDRGLWVLTPGSEPRPLGLQSENFQLSPDGQRLAVSQPTGVSLLPLTPTANPQEFFPNHEALLAFSQRDPNRKLLVRDNLDLTRSLMLYTPEDPPQEVFRTAGFILACEFEPRQEAFLYCLQAEALDTAQAEVQPFLTLVNLKSGNVNPLIELTDDLNVRMDVAADGRTLLFDQVTADSQPTTFGANPIPQGSLWLVTLPDLARYRRQYELDTPQNITAGLDPQWLP